MTADLEKNEPAPYSSASSAQTIPNDEPAYAVDEEEKKADVEDVEKDTALEKVEAVPELEIGEHPDGGLKAWLVVIGVSFYFAHRALE